MKFIKAASFGMKANPKKEQTHHKKKSTLCFHPISVEENY
jgi:hypothetical protein